MNSPSPYLADPLPEPLTQREGEILALLADLTLTNQEIAGQLYLSLTTVKWHVQQIYTKLGVSNRRQAITRALALGLLSLASNGQTRLHYFPLQLTSFIGREREIEEISRIISHPTSRLVTLTGAGGVGKTRLALKVAEQVQRNYRHGAWLVELAPINNSALVTQTVAGVFKLSGATDQSLMVALQGYLGSKELLLVLDNCEHLIEKCASLVDALLKACPYLHILATSREALRVDGEIPFVVPSLPFPDLQDLPAFEQVTQFAALRLFEERARLVNPGFELTQSSVWAVSLICQRLDGIPLALELAAARLKLLKVDELAERLESVFKLLTDGSRTALPRHQTLQGVIDWSYTLMSHQERILLQGLAVFAGGCTLEAAEAVCSVNSLEPGNVLGLLASLAAKSMITVDFQTAAGATRYRLLETVRQYARQKLLESGESARLHTRHRDYYLHMAESSAPWFLTKERTVWIKRFEADHENLRLALEWSFSDPADIEAGPRLVLALERFWAGRHLMEQEKWVQKGIDVCRGEAAISPSIYAPLLSLYSSITYWHDLQSGRALAQQSLAIARGIGSKGKEVLIPIMGRMGPFFRDRPEDWGQVQALLDEQEAIIQGLGSESTIDPRWYQAEHDIRQAQFDIMRGRYEHARTCIFASIPLYKVCGADVHLIWPYELLGNISLHTGDYDQARTYFLKVLPLAVENEVMNRGSLLALLCETEFRQGNLEQALVYCRDYIKLAYEKQTPFNVLDRLEMAARILAKCGMSSQSARLSGAAEALTEKYGRKTSPEASTVSFPGDWRTRFADASLEALVPDWRTRADKADILQAWEEGRVMPYQQAVEYALSLSEPEPLINRCYH